MSERSLRAGPGRRLLVAVAPLVLAAACGAQGTTTAAEPDGELADVAAELEAVLQERDHLPPEDAACVRAQVEASYTPAELRLIIDETVVALPSQRWAGYSYAFLDCVLAEELGLEPATATGPGEAP